MADNDNILPTRALNDVVFNTVAEYDVLKESLNNSRRNRLLICYTTGTIIYNGTNTVTWSQNIVIIFLAPDVDTVYTNTISAGNIATSGDNHVLYCRLTKADTTVSMISVAKANFNRTSAAPGLNGQSGDVFVIGVTDTVDFHRNFALQTHGELDKKTANDHHNQSHVLDGSDHTISGKTPGDVLSALTSSTFGFQKHYISEATMESQLNTISSVDYRTYLWRNPSSWTYYESVANKYFTHYVIARADGTWGRQLSHHNSAGTIDTYCEFTHDWICPTTASDFYFTVAIFKNRSSNLAGYWEVRLLVNSTQIASVDIGVDSAFPSLTWKFLSASMGSLTASTTYTLRIRLYQVTAVGSFSMHALISGIAVTRGW